MMLATYDMDLKQRGTPEDVRVFLSGQEWWQAGVKPAHDSKDTKFWLEGLNSWSTMAGLMLDQPVVTCIKELAATGHETIAPWWNTGKTASPTPWHLARIKGPAYVVTPKGIDRVAYITPLWFYNPIDAVRRGLDGALILDDGARLVEQLDFWAGSYLDGALIHHSGTLESSDDIASLYNYKKRQLYPMAMPVAMRALIGSAYRAGEETNGGTCKTRVCVLEESQQASYLMEQVENYMKGREP